MKAHTIDFKNKITKNGRQLDCKLTYKVSNVTVELGTEFLNSITLHYEGNILKSVMKKLTINSNIPLVKGTMVNYKFGLLVNNNYEYIDNGNFMITSVEKEEDTNSYTMECYDVMINSMKEYTSLSSQEFPMTVKQYFTTLCGDINLELANPNQNFANSSKMIDSDLYAGLGYTYRDILDEIAQVTASTICINNDNKVEVRYINDTHDEIDEEFFKDINVKFGEKYGPINSIVLSRAGNSDKIYLQNETSVEENGLCEINISENQIMNFDNRDEFLPDILNKLDGLEYYINDYSSYGISYYDLCDKYYVKIGDNTYSCIMFNDEFIQTQNIEENIYTEMPEQSETEYKHADTTDRRINRTTLIVNKQEQTINGVVENQKTIQQDMLLTKSQTGYPIEITDAGNYPLIENKVYGNSYQETRSGKNLFNIANINRTNNGINALTENGIITLNGIATANSFSRIDMKGDIYYSNLKAGTYTLSANNSIALTRNDMVRFVNLTGTEFISTRVTLDKVNASVTFTLDEDTENMALQIRISNGTTLNNYIIKPQLEKGTEATSYEPYGAMPSPDFPSEIKNVGVVNLLPNNAQTQTINGVTFTKREDGSILVNGTASGNADYYIYGQATDNGNYLTFNKDKYKINRENLNDGTIFYVFREKTSGAKFESNTNNQVEEFMATQNCQFYGIFIRVQDGKTINNVLIEPMIEKGTIQHDYVPYGNNIIEKIRGKNLFDKDKITINTSINNTNGNTYNDNNSFSTDYINVYGKKEIALSGYSSASGGLWGAYYDINKKFISGINLRNVQLLNIPNNTYYVRLGILNTYLENLMINEGTEVLPYEPYKENKIIVSLNKENLFVNPVNGKYFSSSYNFDNAPNSQLVNNIPAKAGDKFVAHSSSHTTGLVIAAFDSDNNCLLRSAVGGTVVKHTCPANTSYILCSNYQGVQMTTTLFKGDDYTPYYELNKIGNVQDELNIKTGVLTRKIGKAVLKGSENWVTPDGKRYFIQLDSFPYENYYSVPLICNYFKGGMTTHDEHVATPYSCILYKDGGWYEGRLSFNSPNITSVNNWKAWLSNNNVTVYYVLAEPETIQLTKEELTMFEGYNYISVDGEVEPDRLDVTYYTPSKFNAMYATKSDLIITNESIQSSVSKSQEMYDKLAGDLGNYVTNDSIVDIRTSVTTLQTDVASQIEITKDIQENGISKVKTTTGFTFDEEGLTITKTSANTETNINENGMVIHSTASGSGRDEELLNVNSEGVEAYNIKVKTYFHIGSHSRMEDYQDGTGIFYIG